MKTDIKELSEELQDIKIQIGVKEEIIKKKKSELGDFDIGTPQKAEKELERIDDKLKELSSRSKTLKEKARRILDKVG